MEIHNIDQYSTEQIRGMVNSGAGRFVMYKYCISIVFMTFNNPTGVYFIEPGKSAVTPGLGYLFVNLFLGWWGIPWGPIYTIGNIYTILSGGTDLTAEIMGHLNQNDPNYGTESNYNIPGQNVSSGGADTYNIPSN